MELFDEKAKTEAEKVLNSKGKHAAGKELLSHILWNESVQATQDEKTKGKKQVR